VFHEQPYIVFYFANKQIANETFEELREEIQNTGLFDAVSSKLNRIVTDDNVGFMLGLKAPSRLRQLGAELFSKHPNSEAETARRLRQIFADAEKFQPIDKAAIVGNELREELENFIAKYVAETGEKNAIVVADTADQGGALFLTKGFKERIKAEQNAEDLELALAFYPLPNSSFQYNRSWPKLVATFQNKPNTEEVLEQKARAVATFVINNLDVALNLYNHANGLNLVFEGGRF
jgi:hypothetical protein